MNAVIDVPKTENGTETDETRITPDAFADAVHDILMERWPHHGRHADDVEDVTALIADAYIPRIRSERQRAELAELETRTLVDRDRAVHELLHQLKKTVQLFVDGQARERVASHQLGHQLERIGHLVATANADGSSMVATAELAAILSTGVYIPTPVAPLVLAVRPDHRYRAGAFTGLEGEQGRLFHFAFIGWAVVLRSCQPDSQVEPCFLVDGEVHPVSVMVKRGLTLHQLTPA